MHLPLYKIEISGIIIIVRCASVAQSVEQGTENPRVIGSIPIGGTTSKILSFIGKSCKQDFCDEYQIFSFSPQNFASQIFVGTPLEIRVGGCRDKCTGYAAVAHLVERHLAKVEVASSSLVGRSNTKPSLMQKCKSDGFLFYEVMVGNARSAALPQEAALHLPFSITTPPVKMRLKRSAERDKREI